MDVNLHKRTYPIEVGGHGGVYWLFIRDGDSRDQVTIYFDSLAKIEDFGTEIATEARRVRDAKT